MSGSLPKYVVVTGGAGYIGSHTVLQLLAAGYTPIVLDNFSNSSPEMLARIELLAGQKLLFHQLDCTDYQTGLDVLKPYGAISGLIHFAAYKAVGESMEQPIQYYHNNLSTTAAVLGWCKALHIPQLVFSSSCTVYGSPEQLPVTENTPDKAAQSVYGNTKQISEQMIQDSRAELSELKACLLRYFNPIGAHPSGQLGEMPLGRPNNLVPYLTQAAAKLREPLTVFGDDYDTPDGSCIRDYIHVVDLAKAHVKALDFLDQQAPAVHTFNLGTGKGASVLELIHTFETTTGVHVPHTIGPRRAGDVPAIYADVRLAEQTLGWQCEYTLADCLRHAWQWQQTLTKTPS